MHSSKTLKPASPGCLLVPCSWHATEPPGNGSNSLRKASSRGAPNKSEREKEREKLFSTHLEMFHTASFCHFFFPRVLFPLEQEPRQSSTTVQVTHVTSFQGKKVLSPEQKLMHPRGPQRTAAQPMAASQAANYKSRQPPEQPIRGQAVSGFTYPTAIEEGNKRVGLNKSEWEAYACMWADRLSANSPRKHI